MTRSCWLHWPAFGFTKVVILSVQSEQNNFFGIKEGLTDTWDMIEEVQNYIIS